MRAETVEIGKVERSYFTADDVMQLLGVGRRTAYGYIRRVRNEAVSKKKLPEDYPHGKIPKALMKQYYI
ncbi:MAG: transcriptional regulator [Porcincola intestinalis]|jgi:predicted DNA-binding transcriptional regulator AlpA|uniref:Helix-turn-helix domain-containing protein n=1 Tax=Porcincola intestinalis TaxID=2606632 RepID=A0A6L5X2N4_9FIRM|nr:transcriptional regulator [Porcincola intestinalis]MDY5331833.1 transcriptional regulator [Porcincola intestinalis]MSS13683.1 helix-turn-helix domain-containing protein [Porcincola intestinalis]